MASNFSVWLRETARLYLRYMAVGLLGVPLAALYAWAKHADLNMLVVGAVLLVLGFVSVFFLWRWLGDWQVASADATSEAWANLMYVAIHAAIPHQQAILIQQSPGEDLWRRILAANVSAHRVEILDAALKNFLAQQIVAEQEEYRQPLAPQEPPHRSQRQPAWALALNGQAQNAHGLA